MFEKDKCLTVLYVEDDPAQVKLFERQIHKVDWEFIFLSTSSPTGIKKILNSEEVDIIFLDHFLGQKTGLDTLRELRVEGYEIPVVMITNEGDEKLAAEVLRAGGDDYRTKDEITPELLKETIKYVTRKRSHELELKHQARRDGLTGLYNRRHFIERLFEEMQRAARHNLTISLCMLDLNNFKNINDSEGHLAGDSVLQQVSKLINCTIRASDTAARYGGDEFIIFLGPAKEAESKKVAERIADRIDDRLFKLPNGKKVTISACIGVAEFVGERNTTNNMESAKEFINRADQALYLAKKSGENLVERRKYERRVMKPYPVIRENGSKNLEGRIVEYSRGGVRVIISDSLEPETSLRIIIETSDSEVIEREAQLCWINPIEDTGEIAAGLEVELPTEKFLN